MYAQHKKTVPRVGHYRLIVQDPSPAVGNSLPFLVDLLQNTSLWLRFFMAAF